MVTPNARELPSPPDNIVQRPLREQYAEFCARGDLTQRASRYESGLQDFIALVSDPGVASVGINWVLEQLLVGTVPIEAIDDRGRVREIGEFIVHFGHNPPSYTFVNITRTVKSHPHPHIFTSGVMCVNSGGLEIKTAIGDGLYSQAMRIILPLLEMRRGVDRGTPYQEAGLTCWPLKPGVWT